MKTTIANAVIQLFKRKINDTESRLFGKMRIVDPRKAKKPMSQSQLEVQGRFRAASQYAKKQVADADRFAMYEEGISKKMKSAYAVAFNDALTPPRVDEINTSDYYGAVGDIISIQAHDDFEVARVRVTIKHGNGIVVEEGDAVKENDAIRYWKYSAKVKNQHLMSTTISVTAFDYPGNESTLEKCYGHLSGPPAEKPPTKSKPRRNHTSSNSLIHQIYEQL